MIICATSFAQKGHLHLHLLDGWCVLCCAGTMQGVDACQTQESRWVICPASRRITITGQPCKVSAAASVSACSSAL